MSTIIQGIKSFKIVYPQVYSYILPERAQNDGSQKIGYTEKENVDERIQQQVRTAALTEKYTKLWSAPAFFEGGKESFSDKTFHKFLIKNGIERKSTLGVEWFYFNGEPIKSKDLFDLFRKEKFSALQNDNGKREYTLRFEQEEAVKKALEYFEKNIKGEFLWNAKPRFGKTLASYDLAKRLKANKVLIVTNRPAIANSWFDDYEMFIDGYSFISETSSLNNRRTITREQHIKIKPIKPQFTFLSLQDLKGSIYFGGNFKKLSWVADLEWDLLIIDEAHEGIDTGRTDAAFDMIKRNHTLHLSGTPFKALANEKFSNDAIYNWTYLDEQKIKQLEIKEGESGDHTVMPDLKLFTYRISQMITNQVNEGLEIEDENVDYAFDLNEFFRAKDKKFIRENEVKEFLTNLTTNKKYPFSTPELREELKHTFWYVGNRVESVKALEKLLKNDPIFKDYEIIVAAGDGRSFEEEENDIKSNETSYKKVKDAISKFDKTITLSCGQLTTGVTIKEWTAVLMLTDIKSPSLYMQAAFRAQNPYKEFRDGGKLFMKKSAYLFDFAPTRVLEIYDQFANGLNPRAVNGEITERDREGNIRVLLNFFPVISEDINGEMVELDAEKVLTFPNALAASEIVNARFMTNLLFNDSLKGVFNFPKEVEDILDKMPIEKNKRVQNTDNKLDLDDARKVNDNKITKINENTEIILGEKIFKTNTERIVDNLLINNKDQISPKELVQTFSQVSEPLIAKYKEIYKSNKEEINEITKQLKEKVKVIAEEFNSSEIKDGSLLKQKLIETLEDEFVKNKVVEKEHEVVAKVQKTKEEEVRERLRSFTRTIPMFIMANASKKEITIDNFDLEINDSDFIDLTSISKEEFHKLRDGFVYEEKGVRKTFQGVFNKYRFNASIAEFRLKKDQLSNYFTSEGDIFEYIPNQKTNQIFTPKKVVQMMINKLEEQEPSLFTRTDSTFIDLYMKSGMYITEIVKKLFNNTRKMYGSDENCLKHILENQVYGLSPTSILQGITQAYIFGFDKEQKISRKNFIQHDITPEAKQNIAKETLIELLNTNENMKFDAVVGNPPYQEESYEANNRTQPVYYLFFKAAESIASKYCLISPARFLSNQGQTPKEWNSKILNDKHIKLINYYPSSDKIFPSVDIKGGVCIIYRNSSFEYNPIEIFIPIEELNNIYNKVTSVTLENLGELLNNNSSYKFRSEVYLDNPHLIGRCSEAEASTIGSNVFERYPEIFFMEKPNDDVEYIKIYGRFNNIRMYQYIKRKYVINYRNLDKWKVCVPGSNGTGALGEKLSTPIVLIPGVGHNQTFISFGCFDSKFEADSLISYIKTKFSRMMLSVMKTTHNNKTKDVWSKVPLQDFTINSDIDWQKSISEIDQQLYKKYQLSKEEVTFIENNVQPMD